MFHVSVVSHWLLQSLYQIADNQLSEATDLRTYFHYLWNGMVLLLVGMSSEFSTVVMVLVLERKFLILVLQKCCRLHH